jgi:hypothetical protein
MPENRMSPAELSAKFRSLATASVGAEAGEELLVDLGKIFNVASNATFMRRLGSVAVHDYCVSSAA